MSVVWKQNWEWNGCKIVPVYKVCINPPTNIDNLSQSCLNVAVKREMCWQRNVFRNVLKARARVWMPRVRCHVRPLPSRGFDDNFMSVGKIIKWKSTSWWKLCLFFQSLIGSFMTDCCNESDLCGKYLDIYKSISDTFLIHSFRFLQIDWNTKYLLDRYQILQCCLACCLLSFSF